MLRPMSTLTEKVTHLKAPKRDADTDNREIEATVRDIISAVRDARRRGCAGIRQRVRQGRCRRLRSHRRGARRGRRATSTRRPAPTPSSPSSASARFAEAQLGTILPLEIEALPGLHLGHRVIPIERVGCYVPGGRYPAAVGADHDDRAGQGRRLRRGHRLPAAQCAPGDDRRLPSLGRRPHLPHRRRAGDRRDGLWHARPCRPSTRSSGPATPS